MVKDMWTDAGYFSTIKYNTNSTSNIKIQNALKQKALFGISTKCSKGFKLAMFGFQVFGLGMLSLSVICANIPKSETLQSYHLD